MKIIGLMGNSGSGKSTAAAILKDMGAYIIDCDKISREITKPGMPAYYEIEETFGKSIISNDKTIDRRKLGSIVFSDKSLLKKLEIITHGAIADEVVKSLELAEKKGFTLAVIDAPLLTETGLDRLTDLVWLVCCDENIRIKRIAERDHISEKEIKKRFSNQTKAESLKDHADVIIDTTNMSIKEMKEKIKKLKETVII